MAEQRPRPKTILFRVQDGVPPIPRASVASDVPMATPLSDPSPTVKKLRSMVDGSQYQQFFQSMYDGVLITDRKGRMIDVNEKMCKLCRCSRETLCVMNVGEVLEGADAELLDSVAEALAADRHVLIDTLCLCLDGSSFPSEVAVTGLQITDEGQFCFFIRDITERQRAEERLLQQEQDLARERDLLQCLMDTIPDRIFFKDTECRFLRVNESLSRFLGLDGAHEAVGKSDFDFFAEEEAREFYEDDKAVMTTAESILDKMQKITRADGTVQYSSTSKVPIRDDRGQIAGLVGISRDITARVQAEEDLKAAQKQLQRVNRLEATALFAGQIAHDFNNLLVPLLVYPEIIRRGVEKGSQAQKDLDLMENTAQQIADINQDLMALSRRGKVRQQVLDVNAVVLETMEGFRTGVREEGVDIVWELTATKPAIKFDLPQLTRVLQNLCQNAVDAVEGSGQVTVRTEDITVTESFGEYVNVVPGDYVRLVVSDTGSGIPEEIKDKIFDPFFTTKAKGVRRGSGLGLSVVYGIVTDHNSFIDVESAPGAGTTFSIFFPAAGEEVKKQVRPEVYGGSERILVVEDEALQRDVFSRILSDLGYFVTGAATGEEAVALVAGATPDRMPDLLVLDMVLGSGIDGTETYRQALEINPDQKAIIISGFRQPERLALAQDLGVKQCLAKPVRFDVLSAAIRKALDTA